MKMAEATSVNGECFVGGLLGVAMVDVNVAFVTPHVGAMTILGVHACNA